MPPTRRPQLALHRTAPLRTFRAAQLAFPSPRPSNVPASSTALFLFAPLQIPGFFAPCLRPPAHIAPPSPLHMRDQGPGCHRRLDRMIACGAAFQELVGRNSSLGASGEQTASLGVPLAGVQMRARRLRGCWGTYSRRWTGWNTATWKMARVITESRYANFIRSDFHCLDSPHCNSLLVL